MFLSLGTLSMEIRFPFVLFSCYVSSTLNMSDTLKNILNICVDFLEFDWNYAFCHSLYIYICSQLKVWAVRWACPCLSKSSFSLKEKIWDFWFLKNVNSTHSKNNRILQSNHLLHKNVKNTKGLSAYSLEEELIKQKQQQLAGRLPTGPECAWPGSMKLPWINWAQGKWSSMISNKKQAATGLSLLKALIASD